jgi:protein SCO1/2
MMTTHPVFLAIVLSVWIAFGGCDFKGTRASEASDQRTLKTLFPVPYFEGTDQYGEQFRSETLLGHVWVASFMFTSCQTVCPDLNAKQRELQEEFANRGVRFVSISTDPENDTPDALRRYATNYDAKPGVWHFLQMPIDAVRALSTEGFKLMDPESPDMHSTRFVLVDATGMIRGFYDCEDETRVAALRADIRALLEQEAS